jgi:hypothetical protein
MPVRIKITAAPPSNVAPDEVREAWVGVEMTAMPDDGNDGDAWVGEGNIGGYRVKGAAAMYAIEEAGKDEALAFWKNLPHINELRFDADCCEVVPIEADEIRAAIERLGQYQLHYHLWQVDGDEAHRILPLIWPVIKELLTVSDACEAGMVEVKNM